MGSVCLCLDHSAIQELINHIHAWEGNMLKDSMWNWPQSNVFNCIEWSMFPTGIW